jgi:hypothetical protein
LNSSYVNSQDLSSLYKLILNKTDSILRQDFNYTNPKMAVIDSIFNNNSNDCAIRCQNDFKETKACLLGSKINMNEIIFNQDCYTALNFDEFIKNFQVVYDSNFMNNYTLRLHTFMYNGKNTLQTKILIYRAGQNLLIACFLIENNTRKGLFRKKQNWIIKDLCIKNYI